MESAGNNLNGRVLNAVIDFDFIVNTELGLVRFIRDNFQDDRVFDLDVLNKSDREILSLLCSRDNPNPLSIISTQENMCDIDPLYNSFFINYKKEIISKSVSERNILGFVSLVLSSGTNMGINCSISIRDDLEKEQIISHFKRFSFIYKSETSSIKSKDVFYIKDFNFFTDTNIGYDDITHKKIYISPRKYTLDFIKSSDSKLATTNVFVEIGKNYIIKEPNNNEHQ